MAAKFSSLVKRAVLALGVLAAASAARPYIVGVDVSWVLEDESLGATYWHEGKKMDLFDILKDHGVNFIRLRTFVNSCAGYAKESYSGANSNVCWCDLEHTIIHARRVKAHQMGFLLDFHMSDTWASIGKQYVPAAWKGKSDAEMQKLAYNYVKANLDTLIKLGLRPDMVQVGNEINSSMSGVSISNPTRFAALVNAGVKAVRDADPTIKVVMQHGQPRPEKNFMSWYNTLKQYVDFDFIGGSTYGTTNNGDDWREMFGNVVKDGHPVLSLEYTAQRTKLINDVMNGMPGNMGLGTFVWEPTRYSDYPMFDRSGQKYTANARLDELAGIAKLYNATLPDWVRVGTGVSVKHSVKVTANAGGTVSQSVAGASIADGSAVTFSAIPLAGFDFAGWSGDYTGTEKEYTVASLKKDIALTASFRFSATDSLHYEAENAVMNQSVPESKNLGFSGAGYANFDNAAGSSIQFAVCLPDAGEKQVKITFANGSAVKRPVSIKVNDSIQIASVNFGGTGEWTDWMDSTVTLKMPAGVSTVTVTSLTADGGPNIDKIEFVSKQEGGTTKILRGATVAEAGIVNYDKMGRVLRICNGGLRGTARLYNVNGKAVFEAALREGTAMETVALPGRINAGVYYLKVEIAGSKAKIQKLNIQK